MDAKLIIELLKQDHVRVIEDSQSEYSITHTCNNANIYFSSSEQYSLYSNNESNDELLARLSRIIRIEKKIGSEYFPIWTKEDGEITQTDKFVKLKGRYYTMEFLEQLIDRIIEFKKINI